jgi:hypothetical protein
MGETDSPAIPPLLDCQQTLEARMQAPSGPAETLALGRCVLEFAAREEDAFGALTGLLDPSVMLELTAEHRQIAEDLELLAWLLEAMPDSPDIPELSESLARRMTEHIRRDGRLLARAAELQSAAAAKATPRF